MVKLYIPETYLDVNIEEFHLVKKDIDVLLYLYKESLIEYKKILLLETIGLISPYKEALKEGIDFLKKEFSLMCFDVNELDTEILKEFEIVK